MATVREQLLLESDLDRASSWFNLLLSIAVDEADLLYLSAILDGTVVLPALPMSQDRRWQVVRALCRPSDARRRLELESARDATDWGQRRAIAAEAALPDASVKSRWIAELTDSTERSLEMGRSSAWSWERCFHRAKRIWGAGLGKDVLGVVSATLPLGQNAHLEPRLLLNDGDGNFVDQTAVSGIHDTGPPETFTLSQNYPNPSRNHDPLRPAIATDRTGDLQPGGAESRDAGAGSS